MRHTGEDYKALECRGWWERGTGGVSCGHSENVGEIIRRDCRERRDIGSGWGSENSGVHPLKTQRGNSQSVKGKPGEGGALEAKGQRVVAREGSHSQTGMGQKKVHWLQQHGGHWWAWWTVFH